MAYRAMRKMGKLTEPELMRKLVGTGRSLRCDKCGCWYAEDSVLRKNIGDRCDDMSHAWDTGGLRNPFAMPCDGILKLEPVKKSS